MREEVAGFSKVAPEYERGRPDYPPEAADWIAERCGLGPGTTVVDIAAGTGKLTRQLLRSGARVVAVEPLPAMLSELISLLRQVEVVVGTAESTGLPTGEATALTVGEAFHWFSTPEALGEFARILAPAGHLALLWNHKDLTQELHSDLTLLLNRYRHRSTSCTPAAAVSLMESTPLFEAVGERRFRFVHVLDADGLSDRVASTSFIANLSADDRDDVLEKVRALVPGDEVELGYDCSVHLFRRR